jgi:tRNA threonylcarbamoyladenosine biosynthesis protein TsaB
MPSNPMLAIDTSTEIAGVAVLGGGARVALSWDAGRNQTTTVLDQIDRCLALAGLGPADLAGIAVATGPGMFNGLRVGMSLAKGLAYGLDRPILGIPTLRITAEPWIGLGRDVIAVVAAGRGRVVWQRFSAAGEPRDEPVNMAATDLGRVVLDNAGDPCVLVAGELPDEQAALFAEHGVWLRTGVTGRRDPLVLARLGVERLRRMGGDDLPALEPRYVHSRPEAAAGA